MSNQGLNVMSKIFIINKNTMKLKELKKIIDTPKLFISEYFAQLINDVDLESEILLLDRKNRNTFKKQQEITKNRESMIDMIKKFEDERIKSVEANYPPEVLEKAKITVEVVEAELALKKTIEELEIMEKLVDAELHKLKQILFQNKSFTFLKKQQINNFIEDENVTFGKLLIMNHILTDSGFEILQRKLNETPRTDNTDNTNSESNKIVELSDEQIKLWYLTREIKQFFTQHSIINIDFSELLNLENINLFNEGFATVNANTFVNFKNVKNMSLKANNIKNIEPNAFFGLTKLEVLNLSQSNPLLFATLESEAFKSLNSLVQLNMSSHNNQWEEGSENEHQVILKNIDVFKHLSRLNYLELASNQISLIVPDYFKGLCNLVHLDLSNNQIASISPMCLKGLTGLVELNLSQNRLTKIDMSDFSELFRLKVARLSHNLINSVVGLISEPGKMRKFLNIEELHLDKNKLVSLTKDSFINLTSLKVLNLSSNSICILDLDTFSNLAHATHLNLSNNSITQLEKQLFRNLKNLEHLDIKNNLLISIDSNQFLYNSRLKSLNLESNKIVKLGDAEAKPEPIAESHFNQFAYWHKMSDLILENPRAGPFRRLYNLEDLNLSNNALTHLQNDHFQGLDSLKTLDLACNKISSIESLTFRLLKYLKYLNLASNCLVNVDNFLFKSLAGLEKLYLNNNQLESISTEHFRDQRNVKILCLDYNRIERIETRSFFNLKEIVTLNLESNKLTEVECRTFDGLEKLTTLVLTNNQFNEETVEKLKEMGQKVFI